jgi:hypothetical protein
VLDAAPSATVTLVFTSSDTSEGRVQSPATRSFGPADWDRPQRISVRGIDDAEADGDQPYSVSVEVSSDDAAYNGLAVTPLALINRDDERDPALFGWLDPAAATAYIDSPLDLVVRIDSHGSTLGAYRFELGFDPERIRIDTGLGNNGVDTGAGACRRPSSTPTTPAGA